MLKVLEYSQFAHLKNNRKLFCSLPVGLPLVMLVQQTFSIPYYEFFICVTSTSE